MGKLIYIVVLIFVMIWIVGFFFYSLGAFIHAALLLALVILVFKIFVRRRTPRDRKPERVRYARESSDSH